MNNIFLLSICERSYMVQVFLIVKIFFKILCILAPIIIIIASIVNMFKVINSGKEEDIKDNVSMLVRRIIAGLLIFFLPSIISYVFTDIVKADDVSFISCFETASASKVKSLKEKEAADAKAEAEREKREAEAREKENYQKDQRERDKQKSVFEEEKKKKEEEERKKQEEERRRQQEQNGGGSNGGNSGGSGGGAGSVPAEVSAGTSNIIIGDSRTVGMCAAITGDWTKCQYSNGGKANGSDFFIAQGAMGFSWFNGTAVAAVNKIISANPNTKYNIYSLMGVNHLLSEIDKYIPTYNSLATGAWKNHKIILVSVGPVNESIEAQHGYSTKNANIETFNAKLKNGVKQSNVAYCDIYTPLGINFGTSDGLHYNGATYKQIYNIMKQC